MAYIRKPTRGRTPGSALARKFSPEQRSKTKDKETPLGVTGKQGRQAVREAKGQPALGIIPKGVEQAETKRASEKNMTKIINNLLKRDMGSRTIKKMINQLRKKIDTGKTSGLEKPMAMAKKGGTVSRKGGGTVKKQAGGLPVGYDARLRESLAARHPTVRGNLAARAAESEGMERALGRRPYAAVRTMDRPIKKGGSVRRKKGGTTSRKSGGKIMVGYKAGGKV